MMIIRMKKAMISRVPICTMNLYLITTVTTLHHQRKKNWKVSMSPSKTMTMMTTMMMMMTTMMIMVMVIGKEMTMVIWMEMVVDILAMMMTVMEITVLRI